MKIGKILKSILFCTISTFSLLLNQCSPVKVATRKIDKAVNLSSPNFVIGYVASKYNTSASLKDTIIVKEKVVSTDTFLLTQTLLKHDTIILEKRDDRVSVKLVKVRDTVKIKAECKSDTIIIQKEINVTKPVQEYNNTLTNLKKCSFSCFVKGTLIGIVIALVLGLILRFMAGIRI